MGIQQLTQVGQGKKRCYCKFFLDLTTLLPTKPPSSHRYFCSASNQTIIHLWISHSNGIEVNWFTKNAMPQSQTLFWNESVFLNKSHDENNSYLSPLTGIRHSYNVQNKSLSIPVVTEYSWRYILFKSLWKQNPIYLSDWMNTLLLLSSILCWYLHSISFISKCVCFCFHTAIFLLKNKGVIHCTERTHHAISPIVLFQRFVMQMENMLRVQVPHTRRVIRLQLKIHSEEYCRYCIFSW